MLLTELHDPHVGHLGSQLDNLSPLSELGRVLDGRGNEPSSLGLNWNWNLLPSLLRLRLVVSWRIARHGLDLRRLRARWFRQVHNHNGCNWERRPLIGRLDGVFPVGRFSDPLDRSPFN